MRSFSRFEKEVLSYMKGFWDKDGYSTIKKALENTVKDFKLELSNSYGSSLSTTEVTNNDEEIHSPQEDLNQLKLAKKLGDILAIINLVKGLVEDNLLLLDKDLRQLPKPMIISNLKSDKNLRTMTLFGDYLDFFRDYYYSRLFPTQDLIDFIENDFKSKADIEKLHMEEKYNRQYRVSIIALVISLVVGISSILFNIINLVNDKSNETTEIIHKVQLMGCNPFFSATEQDSVIPGKLTPAAKK